MSDHAPHNFKCNKTISVHLNVILLSTHLTHLVCYMKYASLSLIIFSIILMILSSTHPPIVLFSQLLLLSTHLPLIFHENASHIVNVCCRLKKNHNHLLPTHPPVKLSEICQSFTIFNFNPFADNPPIHYVA